MMTPADQDIQDQVKLPVRVAFQVVLQGMRIRFGRSLVTLMGVVLGIAFLMSILTSQLLKTGVSAEHDARLELQRMRNFLESDMGTPSGEVVGVLQAGRLSAMEKRFVRRLVQMKVRAFNWHFLGSLAREDESELQLIIGEALTEAELGPLGEDSLVLLLMGDGQVPADAWDAVSTQTADMQIATTQNVADRRIPGRVRITQLARQQTAEELTQQKAEKRTARFRDSWIIAISLLVTVFGISNAMLMSVTERFREIGTMKCLGALSAFVRQIFLFESCLLGAVGGLAGGLIGSLFSATVYAFTYGLRVVVTSLVDSAGVLALYLLLTFGAGVGLSMLAAIYPAKVASRMVPADALRSNV